MSVLVQQNTPGLFELELNNEPPFVHALKMAPSSREQFLNNGQWLVVAFSVWSSIDRQAVRNAIDCVSIFNGRLQLGIRPFDYPEELQSWLPEFDGVEIATESMLSHTAENKTEIRISAIPSSSPVWALIKDAKILWKDAGFRTKEQLITEMAARTE